MYLFAFLLLFYFIVFVVRSYLVWRATGINPVTFENKDDAHSFNGLVFKIISVLTLIIVGVYAFGGKSYAYLLPFWYLENKTLLILGWSFLSISLIWIAVAQIHMANSWRIGIDTKKKSELVTKGLFAISRNPIFLGILIANIGLFLVIPNAFTLLILMLSFIVMGTQIRLEEAFLMDVHGANYERYFQKVRRWI